MTGLVPVDADIGDVTAIEIPYLARAEWGVECFRSVCAQVLETVERQTGQKWMWRQMIDRNAVRLEPMSLEKAP